MPYNTRRVSLSLPSLGIQLPHSSRSAAARHRSPPSASAATSSPRSPDSSTATTAAHALAPAESSPPTKRAKRGHRSRPTPRAPAPVSSVDAVQSNTPPPSPGNGASRPGSAELDTTGIGDDVVAAAIDLIHRCGNRPHSAKELASSLRPALAVVDGSANPTAIVASRLTAYLRRPWTAFAPCPLARQLVESHPRKTYFYLAAYPHQPIPIGAAAAATAARNLAAASRIISPALSSATDEESEDREVSGQRRGIRGGGDGGDDDDDDVGEETFSLAPARARFSLSPSPEIDLSTAEFGQPGDVMVDSPMATPGMAGVGADASTVNVSHNRRAASPPLEREEREFSQTASTLQERRHQQLQAEQLLTTSRSQIHSPQPRSPPSHFLPDASSATTAAATAAATPTTAERDGPRPPSSDFRAPDGGVIGLDPSGARSSPFLSGQITSSLSAGIGPLADGDVDGTDGAAAAAAAAAAAVAELFGQTPIHTSTRTFTSPVMRPEPGKRLFGSIDTTRFPLDDGRHDGRHYGHASLASAVSLDRTDLEMTEAGGKDAPDGVTQRDRAREREREREALADSNLQWNELRTPELVGVEELEEMFGGY